MFAGRYLGLRVYANNIVCGPDLYLVSLFNNLMYFEGTFRTRKDVALNAFNPKECLEKSLAIYNAFHCYTTIEPIANSTAKIDSVSPTRNVPQSYSDHFAYTPL